jgi:hypothetical protein
MEHNRPVHSLKLLVETENSVRKHGLLIVSDRQVRFLNYKNLNVEKWSWTEVYVLMPYILSLHAVV